MDIRIGSYEAKTKLPELLRGVQAGNRYVITLRGEAIAELSPIESKHREASMAADQMREFMLSGEVISGLDLKELIEDGRP
jgi:antitoxin (DNA-binding transcriptional repressor) of toxin-antitoxin stability system